MYIRTEFDLYGTNIFDPNVFKPRISNMKKDPGRIRGELWVEAWQLKSLSSGVFGCTLKLIDKPRLDGGYFKYYIWNFPYLNDTRPLE